MANYLRVRGEYKFDNGFTSGFIELPPRARRILQITVKKIRINRTTSACAENTSTSTTKEKIMANYLRVRGEYRRQLLTPAASQELPPRARRIHR